MSDKTVDQILNDAAELFKLKNEGYGDAYKRQPKILHALLGEVTLKTEDDYARFLRVTSVITKLNRFCTSFNEGGHLDSAHDLTVFAAMLQEQAEKELDGEPICETKKSKSKFIHLKGMTGMGDSIYQRAVVSYLTKKGYNVQIETPFPQFYEDFANVNCIPLRPIEGMFENFRTSKENIEKEKFGKEIPTSEFMHITYTPKSLKEAGSFLGAIKNSCNVPKEFNAFHISLGAKLVNEKLPDEINKINKPILLYKPITERKEWRHSAQRNPDALAYEELINHIIRKNKYHIVSVASLKEDEEWIVGSALEGATTFHNGELNVRQLCTLVRRSSLVFCPPGFLLPISQAILTKSICVFGGRENSSMYKESDPFTSTLGIDTIAACNCFDDNHKCEKEIDIEKAKKDIDLFIGE